MQPIRARLQVKFAFADQKPRKNGTNLTSFWEIASVISDFGGPWTGWISADKRVLSGRRIVVMVWWAAAGFDYCSLTFRFSWTVTLVIFRRGVLRATPAWALLHRCFPSNLSTTTQRAIVKLRGMSSELCTLLYWSVWNRKTALAAVRKLFWDILRRGDGGLRGIVSQEVDTMKS